jgi:MoxR-like ATPase
MTQTNTLFEGFDDLFKDMTKTEDKQVKEEAGVTAKPTTSAPIIETPVSINNVLSAQTKLKTIEQEMNAILIERDEAIRCLMLAVISGQSMLMLGDPGTGKSFLTYEFCSRIEQGTYFQWMLNKTSDPSELLGPVSIKGMENDHYTRVTTGKLPEAHIAFIDECYKANAPVLNILLPIMNEKIFYNDGKPNPIPLITMVGASNEGPEDESLMAFHDRFLFRINVKYVKDAANKKRMYTNFINGRRGLNNLVQKTTITIDEIHLLNEESKNINVPKDIINQFIKFINILDKQTIHVSDRRQNECFKIMQASAVLRGAKSVGIDDFKSLTYVLWEKEEHIPIIQQEIAKLVNPFDDKIREYRASFETIRKDIESCTDENEKSSKSLEAKGGIEKITSKLNKLIIDATKQGKDTSEFIELRDTMTAYSNEIVQNALGASLGF